MEYQSAEQQPSFYRGLIWVSARAKERAKLFNRLANILRATKTDNVIGIGGKVS